MNINRVGSTFSGDASIANAEDPAAVPLACHDGARRKRRRPRQGPGLLVLGLASVSGTMLELASVDTQR